MAVKIINSQIDSTGGSTTKLTWQPTLGNILVVLFAQQVVAQPPKVTDSHKNTYTLIQASNDSTDGDWATLAYTQVTDTGPNFTIGIPANGSVIIAELAGVNLSNPIDNFGGATAQNTAATFNLNITKNQTFVIGGAWSNGTAANVPGTGYITVQEQVDDVSHERIYMQAGYRDSGVRAFNFTASALGWVGVAVAFNAAPTSIPNGPFKIDASLGALNSSQSSSQLVRTSTGNLYAVISMGVTPFTLRVYKSTNNGVSWAEQDYENVPSTSVVQTAIAIDGNDNIHITYHNNSASTTQTFYILYSTSTDTFGRSERVTVTGGAGTNGNRAIAIDQNNIPHIVESHQTASSNGLGYTNRLGGYWKATANIGSNLNGFSGIDIQIDRNNVPQISYQVIGTGAQVAIGNKNNVSSWTITTVISDTATASRQTSLTIDASGNTWLGYSPNGTNRIRIVKHLQTDSWATWQTAIDNSTNGSGVSLAADQNDIYVFYERNLGGIAYDRYDTINAKWLGETILQPATLTFRPHNPFVKWSQYFNNGDTGANNANQQTIEYLFDDGNTVYYDKLVTAQISTGFAEIKFTPAVAGTTTSTSSTSSSTSTSTSTSSTSTSTSLSTSSTSSSTSISTSTSSTSQSTSTSVSTSSTSSSTSISTSSTSSSISTSSTSSSISTSSTSRSTSTSSTSSSISTSSTSSSTSTSISTSSTSQSTSTSTSISTSSTSSSISTSSTSSSISTSTSLSTSSTSQSTSTSVSTSTSSTSSSTSMSSTSQSTSTSISTSSTSSSISTSSTSSSTSLSTSSTSSSISTSSTSSSTSTSISTSSTSQSTSTSRSTSTSSTSSSTSVSTSSTSSSISTSSTSSSISTSSTSSSTSLSTSSTSSSTSTSQSTSTSSTSQSTSTSLSTSTSSTSSSTSTTVSLTTSTSSTSSSTSQSTSTSSTSTSLSTSTSSTSSSTSISTSSTSSSTSLSTSSTSQSTSTSISTSSTSTSISTSTSLSTSSTSTSISTSTTTALTTTSTSSTSVSSTSSSTSTTTTVIDYNTIPRVRIHKEQPRFRIVPDRRWFK